MMQLFIFLSSLILVKFATQGLMLCLEELFNRKCLNYQTAFRLFFIIFGNPVILASILSNSPDLLTCPTNDFFLKLIIFCLPLFFTGVFTIIGLNSSQFQNKKSTGLYIFVNAFSALCFTFVSSIWGFVAIIGLLSEYTYRPGDGSAVLGLLVWFLTGIAILLSLITTVGWFIYLWKKSDDIEQPRKKEKQCSKPPTLLEKWLFRTPANATETDLQLENNYNK